MSAKFLSDRSRQRLYPEVHPYVHTGGAQISGTGGIMGELLFGDTVVCLPIWAGIYAVRRGVTFGPGSAALG